MTSLKRTKEIVSFACDTSHMHVMYTFCFRLRRKIDGPSSTDFTMVGRYKCRLLYISLHPVRLLFRENVEQFHNGRTSSTLLKFHVDPCGCLFKTLKKDWHKGSKGWEFILVKSQLFWSRCFWSFDSGFKILWRSLGIETVEPTELFLWSERRFEIEILSAYMY